MTGSMVESNEASLLPSLLRILAKEGPRMRVVVLPVQFRTVGELCEVLREEWGTYDRLHAPA